MLTTFSNADLNDDGDINFFVSSRWNYLVLEFPRPQLSHLNWHQLFMDRFSCVGFVRGMMHKIMTKYFKMPEVDDDVLDEFSTFGRERKYGIALILDELRYIIFLQDRWVYYPFP